MQLGYVPARNQYPIRTIIRHDGEVGRAFFLKAKRERENFKKRLWRAKNRDKVRAYQRRRRERPGEREAARERKRAWRAGNREHYNAYHRRYSQLTPGRKEYKARKAREYRARDKAARNG